jgi:hypothetical protein
MDIQAGKTYRSRSGEVFGPIEPCDCEAWMKLEWFDPNTDETWGKDGLYLPITRTPDPLDLIEEVE